MPTAGSLIAAGRQLSDGVRGWRGPALGVVGAGAGKKNGCGMAERRPCLMIGGGQNRLCGRENRTGGGISLTQGTVERALLERLFAGYGCGPRRTGDQMVPVMRQGVEMAPHDIRLRQERAKGNKQAQTRQKPPCPFLSIACAQARHPASMNLSMHSVLRCALDCNSPGRSCGECYNFV